MAAMGGTPVASVTARGRLDRGGVFCSGAETWRRDGSAETRAGSWPAATSTAVCGAIADERRATRGVSRAYPAPGTVARRRAGPLPRTRVSWSRKRPVASKPPTVGTRHALSQRCAFRSLRDERADARVRARSAGVREGHTPPGFEWQGVPRARGVAWGHEDPCHAHGRARASENDRLRGLAERVRRARARDVVSGGRDEPEGDGARVRPPAVQRGGARLPRRRGRAGRGGEDP